MNTTIKNQTSVPPLRAFFGKKAIKAKYVSRVRKHREADQIRQGFGYWKKDDAGKFRGCAVGCTLHSDSHAAYEIELGVPRALARLEDRIFERLPAARALDWPTQFLEAIPVGADLSLVIPKFLLWLLVDGNHGVLRFARNAKSKNAIENVAALLRRKIAGDDPSIEEWRKAREAAAWAARWGRRRKAHPIERQKK